MIYKTLILLFSITVSLFSFATSPLLEMGLEEKVGQLLMVHFHGEQSNDEARLLIQKIHVGGIIYYNWANGLSSPEQVLNLSRELQQLSAQNRIPIPLFISVDQEGGIVSRLTNGFTVFPGNKALGMSGDPQLAESCARAIGQELKAVGINFNFSPVVDINNNPYNPVIGIRSFGDSPEIVIPFAKSMLSGYRQEGIITSLKHFPGHGDVEVDSHQDLPTIKKSKEQLQAFELRPFFELAKQTDTVMTAHLMVPSIDPINCATLSKDILDILRKEIGFQSVIISDSLVMEGLLKNCTSIDEAAIRALNAGCDILMIGGKQLLGSHKNLELTPLDIERVHQTLVDAVKKGIITEQRLNEAVGRILDLKNKYNLSIPDQAKDLFSLVQTPIHQQLAKAIAASAIRVTERKNIFPNSLQEGSVSVVAPVAIQDVIKRTSLLHLGKENSVFFFNDQNLADVCIKPSDIIIFCAYNAWKNKAQLALFQSLLAHGKPMIVICLRDLLDATLFSEADLVLTTFSPTFPSIQAACEVLSHQLCTNEFKNWEFGTAGAADLE